MRGGKAVILMLFAVSQVCLWSFFGPCDEGDEGEDRGSRHLLIPHSLSCKRFRRSSTYHNIEASGVVLRSHGSGK
jgi:hypothetical protein